MKSLERLPGVSALEIDRYALHLSAGYLHEGFSNRLFVSRLESRNGFFANAHGLEPRRVDTGFEHDRLYGNGNQVFIYTQSQVFRYGGEAHAHVELPGQVRLGIIGEYIYSVQLSGEKEGFGLPFSPAPSLVHLAVGTGILAGGRTLQITLQVRNLLNRKYFNHISYYRLIHVPEPGRNFILTLSVPFETRM